MQLFMIFDHDQNSHSYNFKMKPNSFTKSQISNAGNTDLIWKVNDSKAQKNGSHSNIYWVKKQPLNQDGSQKANKWVGSHKYVGDWKDNQKNGFGIQYYSNGDKYEGGWSQNKRHGQGTFWVADSKSKLRREYTGDWENDSKQGRGTMFYKTGDRYDGMWMDSKPHGQGRMIYSNGDVYEGMWYMGKRSGYGVMTKRCGDHFQGHWVNDMREGQGSYFFCEKNKIFVGQWVLDAPKTGVYSEVEDPASLKIEREKHFTDPYILPQFDQIGLQNPTSVLQQSIEKARKNRTAYRAKHIPLDELYTRTQLHELQKQFAVATVNQTQTISQLGLEAILMNMGIAVEKEDLWKHLQTIRPGYKQDEIDYELFVRIVALLLELKNLGDNEDTQALRIEEEQDAEEENKWYNQQS